MATRCDRDACTYLNALAPQRALEAGYVRSLCLRVATSRATSAQPASFSPAYPPALRTAPLSTPTRTSSSWAPMARAT